jgi:tRNA(adenine34) deaminase
MNDDEKWMMHAIGLARQAEQQGEVPIGAVVIENDTIISEGWNRPISTNDPTAHAEIEALRSAGLQKNNYRLPGLTLYVTLEPCAMCSGAIFNSRIARVVFGAYDIKSGTASGLLNLFEDQRLNHHTQLEGGVLEDQCAQLLTNFFKERR